MQVKRMGNFGGQTVEQVSLVSSSGVEVDIMNYGGVVRDWRVPLADGLRSVVLGFDTFAPYPQHSPHFGSLTGRVANRIAGAKFKLDGTTYKLPVNEGKYCLHGGPEGLGRQVWTMEPDSARQRVRLTHHSPDGAMGFPGNVEFEALYTLEGHKLRLDLSARADRNTPISLVQHQYFNLGTGPDVLDHDVRITADRYTQVSRNLLPDGEVLPVDGTIYDLRTGRQLRDASGAACNYDINLCLPEGRNPAEPVVSVTGPDRALTLKLWSDRPGVQFYNGVWTNIKVPGLGGRTYGRYSGLCFEDQAWPGALHHAHFPSIIYGPDRPYQHFCEIEVK